MFTQQELMAFDRICDAALKHGGLDMLGLVVPILQKVRQGVQSGNRVGSTGSQAPTPSTRDSLNGGVPGDLP